MIKKILLPVLLLAWLSSACTGSSQKTPTATALPEAYNTETSASTPITQPTPQSTRDASTGSGCTVVSPQPTPGPTEQSLFPPVSEEDWVRGPSTAPVTVMIYSDYQCPFCANLETVLSQLAAENPQDVRIFSVFPLVGTPDRRFTINLPRHKARAAGLRSFLKCDLLFEKDRMNECPWLNSGIVGGAGSGLIWMSAFKGLTNQLTRG
jgi:hypothetical protein